MSSPAEQFPSNPDDPADTPDDGSGGADSGAHQQARRRRAVLQERAQATLARKVAKAARSHRKIAKATAKRARDLEDLRRWSSDPVNAKPLNPGYATGESTGPVLTDADASRRRVAAWEDQEIARRTVTSEVACTLHLADRTAENLIGEAMMFAGPMTSTLQSMGRGEISYRHGQVLMQQLSFLPPDDVAELEAKLLPAAKELTVGKLAGKARRLRERAHPETIDTRVTAAVAERGVWWEGRDDGMGTLTWYGTAEQTMAVHDRLTSIADAGQASERRDPGIAVEQRRTIAQLCADAMADLLLNGVTPAGTGGGITGNVMVTVPVLTAMDQNNQPGFLEGYGPIPAHTARQIAAGAPSWCRLLTHPETGTVLSVGRDRYSVPADMRRAIRLRDGTCRFPFCNRPASRSDIDHTRAWQFGGPTDYDNLAHLCAYHHRLKHHTLWAVEQEHGGVLLWTSPAGKTHRTYPETYLGPPPTRPLGASQPAPRNPPATSQSAEDPPPF